MIQTPGRLTVRESHMIRICRSIFGRVLLLAAALSMTACAVTPPGAGLTGTGQVLAINESRQVDATTTATTQVGGALMGAAIGSLFGSGRGRGVMTGVGAAAGTIAGTAVAQQNAPLVWDIVIRFDDGIDRILRVSQPPQVRPGQRVRVFNGAVLPY
jgi:outer membrane lipoprotein SlyB